MDWASLAAQVTTTILPLVVALIALRGVHTTNDGNTARLIDQQRHDANQKEIDRAFNLRRDVCLSVVAAEPLVFSKIGKFVDTLQKDRRIDLDFNEFLVAAAKLELVAEPGTAMAISKLSAEYAAVAVKMIEHSLPLSAALDDISIRDTNRELAKKAVDAALLRLGEARGQENEKVGAFAAARQEYDQVFARWTTASDAYLEALSAFARAVFHFQKMIIPSVRELGSSRTAALVAMRRDLGQSADLKAYAEQVDRQWTEMWANMERIHTQLDANLDDENLDG